MASSAAAFPRALAPSVVARVSIRSASEAEHPVSIEASMIRKASTSARGFRELPVLVERRVALIEETGVSAIANLLWGVW